MQDKSGNERVIDEIMGLVTQHAHIYYSSAIGGYRDADDVKESERTIESKLRELVENKFSVRKPLSDADCEEIYWDWVDGSGSEIDLVRAIEHAHGIFEKN